MGNSRSSDLPRQKRSYDRSLRDSAVTGFKFSYIGVRESATGWSDSRSGYLATVVELPPA